MNNLVGDVRVNPRGFYQWIRGKKKRLRYPTLLKKRSGSGVAQSDLEKAEEFNDQFTDMFNKNEYSQVPLLHKTTPFIENTSVSKEGVT